MEEPPGQPLHHKSHRRHCHKVACNGRSVGANHGDGIVDKAVEPFRTAHLVEPVRFRELTKTLHEQGVRVFLQVGSGSLPGFVNDTLRGEPHLAISVAAPNRSGILTLQKALLSLFVEGASLAWEKLLPAKEAKTEPRLEAVPSLPRETHVHAMPTQAVGHDLLAEMEALFADIQLATRDVLAAMKTVAPFQKVFAKTLRADAYDDGYSGQY